MAHDDNNNCVICLESLCSADIPIGATVPCGHCFHVECFAGWKHSKRGQSNLKCPMCNHPTTAFCRIYLDLGAVDDDQDDGCSLSSVESAVMGDEEDEEEKEDSAESEETDEHDVAPPENDTVDNDVICVDDDVSSSDKVKSDESSHNKYRKMAKKLKAKVKMLESERKRLAETAKTFLQQHGKLKMEIQETASQVEDIRTSMGPIQRKVEHLSLDITRVRRERDEATRELHAAKTKVQNLETKMAEMSKQYNRDVERAHANSMTEVQTILNQHPKLTESNRRLKEELQRKEERIQRLEARYREGSLHKNNTKTVSREQTEPQDSVKSVYRASKDRAKLLRDFHDHQDDAAEKLSAQAQPDHHLDVKKRMKGKVSANAARFSRASEKPVARLPAALSALDAIDQDLQKRPSLEQARKFTNAPPRKRAKISLSAAATASNRPFGLKKGPQNDIRNMLPRRR
jgi:uncharacterized protein YoxC